MTSPDPPGWSASGSDPPGDIPEEGTPVIMLPGGRMVPMDPPLIRAMRLYVGQYIRVNGRRRFLDEFGVAASVLEIWEDDYVGYSIPRRVLERVGTDLHGVMSAAEELRLMEPRPEADANEDIDPEDSWVVPPGDEGVTPVVRVRPRPSEEREAHGDQIAVLMRRWRYLRERTSAMYDQGKANTGDYLFHRDILLTDVEPRLIARGVRVMGGGTGHQLDELLWSSDRVGYQMRMREVARNDVRARRRRSLLRRIRDLFRRDVKSYPKIPEG